jgi:CPA2 family monovalent cation:H+ antiporter-2
MKVEDILQLLVIIFGISGPVILLLHRVKAPSIVGFLIAGIILGPYGFGFVQDVHGVELLSEIGVILLLFVIGIEFSISDFIKARGAIVAGGLQVVITIALVAALTHQWTGQWKTGFFDGFLVALSSTAIVLKILADKNEIDSYHGRVMLGILIFQDFCLVPMMFFVPVLAGGSLEVRQLTITFTKAIAVIVFVFLAGRWIVPRLLYYAVLTKSRELFIVAVVSLCLGIALITSKFGLSLAIGAFLAGLIISESEYAHQAVAEILPLKELFIGLFFVSVGMLLDVNYLFSNLVSVVKLFVLLFLIKSIVIISILLIQKYPLKTAVYVGLGLAQVGEFSFVLAGVGKSLNLININDYQQFLSVSILTMLAAPFILLFVPYLAHRLDAIESKKRQTLKEVAKKESKIKDHVIIVGYGLTGKTLAKTLNDVQINYAILDLNINTVRAMLKKNEPIYYGDATKPEILHTLGIAYAKMLVLAINAPGSVRRIVEVAKKENPDIYIIVRTRYVMEVDALRKAGADEVIPEEFEVSIEIFARVLHYYQMPYNTIADYVDAIRSDSYLSLRGVNMSGKNLFASCSSFPCNALPHVSIEAYLISGQFELSTPSLKEIDLRAKTGATIISIRRDEEIITNPGAHFLLAHGDVLYLTGDNVSIKKAIHYIEALFKKSE